MEVKEVKILDLILAEYNPRSMTEKEAKDLEQSLKIYGMVEPIVVNGSENRRNIVIGGHQRLQIWSKMGNQNIPVVYVDISEIEKERELNLRLNKNSGHWDWDLLANFDEKLLIDVGFDQEEIIVGFGLNGKEDIQLDLDRLQVLEVLPPESPVLKEKARIHFEKIEDYNKVKAAVIAGEISSDDILRLLK